MLTQVCGDGLTLTITPYQDGMLRVQAQGYDGPIESLLERYGFVNALPVEEAAQVTGQTVTLPGGVALELGDGGWRLLRDGAELAVAHPTTRVATASTVYRNQGYQLDLRMAPGEKFIGFGDQTRTQFLLNGQRDALWVRYPVKHVPVPFFMSSHGYGIFFNTTRKLHFDVGASDPNVASFTVAKDFLDLYIITGDNYDEMIEKYTRLTGRPALPPLKSFGLWLLFHSRATGHDVLAIAKMLRDQGIACDNLSLEPHWMEKTYDYTVNKEWNAERFRGCPAEVSYRAGADFMIHALNRMGYDLGLWLCSRWDFTWEEERRLALAAPAEAADAGPGLAGLEISHVDENVGHLPELMDTNTVRDQAWFEHLKKFVKDGVRFFKMDPAVLI
ncbi:MAG TPA: TIM-barrel domain-containing protein, partial [Armatimonadota bacterium]